VIELGLSSSSQWAKARRCFILAAL